MQPGDGLSDWSGIGAEETAYYFPIGLNHPEI